MLSLSSTSSTLFSSKLPFPPSLSFLRHPTTTRTTTKSPPSSTAITASSNNPPLVPNIIIPKNGSSSPQPQNLYQPFRPPANPLPQKYKNLDTSSIIDVLANRFGIWHEYAPLISTLFREGFTPPVIEELTGISGVEQNRLIVAAQVLESIAESPEIDPQTLAFFDSGGSELLYELRLLSASQRAAAANYIIRNKLDGEKARDIAKSIKDFPARKEEAGFRSFDYTKTGDCWAFWNLRIAREFTNLPEKRKAVLEIALEVAESDAAKARIRQEIGGEEAVLEEIEVVAVKVPVVRLKMGEVAEATSVVVLPVSEAREGADGVGRVPMECRSEGEFGVVVADKGWDRWVVLPRWSPIANIGPAGVAVACSNAKVLPWRVNRTYLNEAILVVLDRSRTAVEVDDGFYLASGLGDSGVDGGLKVEKGSTLKRMGVSESLGTVVIVVRPPTDEIDDQLSDIDWD